MYCFLTSPLGIFSLADVGYFVTSLLALGIKISGTIVTGAGIVLLLVDLILIYFDVWLMYLSIPVLSL